MAKHYVTTPLSEDDVRKFRAGDEVYISGTIYTGRDAVHKYLATGGKPPVELDGSVIYHCGPVIVGGKGNWEVKAAGPTTSAREEPYQGDLINKYKIRGVIGKGGMGKKTLEACQKTGAAYLHAIGGAAQVYADVIKGVTNVYLEEFGSPEAIWELQVNDFMCIVTMDSHGKSLHEEVSDKSSEIMKEFV